MINSSPNHLDVDDVLIMGAEQQSRRKSQLNLNLIGSNTKPEPYTHNSYTNRAIMAFVDAVCKMNDEVLVPSRLRDIEVRETEANELMPQNSDLYSFYKMLNTVKKDLFSSSLFYKTFQPNPSASNSGQNSGRVTPTHSLSRRSSYSVGSSNGLINNTTTTTTNGTQTNGTKISPTLLLPPTQFDRKLSSPCPMMHSPNDDSSLDLLSPTSLLPSLSLSYVSRATSLSSLLAAAGHTFDDGNETPEDHVHQITGCFMYHLSALYTIMGHFTKAAKFITKRYQEEMNNNL
ncbi:uncharacterized protein LOC124495492 [Dermatophagoides farinae]|uniref:uncharacterized protein LOC124495492 n=1 Tax=Dermatophagoides farinae TaxID=6954 RepID=UPI001F0F095E|nr:LOW QUALITY PROTEIN: uncharacterized protein LOC124495492 [Dermatophagoides farinae]